MLVPGQLIIERPGEPPDTLYTPLEHQQKFHASTAKYCLMGGSAGTGKATHIETLIPTPKGLVPMAALRVGDEVFDELGRPTEIVWKSDTHIDPLGTWRLTFDTGEQVICGGGHEWVTTTYAERMRATRGTLAALARRRARRAMRAVDCAPWRRQPRTKTRRTEEGRETRTPRTTEEIARTLTARGGSHHNHSVPTSGLWDTLAVPLPLDPYLLGAWLGDGSALGGSITKPDQAIFDRIASIPGEQVTRIPSDPMGHRVKDLTARLRAMGLLKNKHIPADYLWASADQRLALLQGLMDTDGYADPRQGSVEFCSTTKALAEGVLHLARSLGIKATLSVSRAMLYGQDYGPKYRVTWTSTVPVFWLERKRRHLPSITRPTQSRHYIVAAERIDDVPLQCIQVAAASHEYLVTPSGIPTHNSLAMRMDAYARCLTIPRFRAIILRRQMPSLRASHLEYVPHEIVRLGLKPSDYHQTYNLVRFGNGSTLRFDHCEDDTSLPRFLSSEFEAIYFDELATFTLRQFKFVSSRARTTIAGLTPIVRGGTNPLGIGAQWVKMFFVTKQVPEKIDRTYKADQYEYIHSVVDENPYINTDYEESLRGLPSDALVRAMRYGEWVIEGAFFRWEPQRDGKPWHVIGEMPRYHGRPIQYAPHIEIVRVIDWGYAAEGNPGACHWFACLPDGSAICFQEYYFKETIPEEVAREILAQSEGLRVKYTVGDTAMWAEHVGPSIAERFAQSGISMVEADKEREAGWVEVHTWLKQTVNDGTGPRPRLSYLESGCPKSIQTMPDMVIDPKNTADMLSVGVEDEAADNARYFVMSRPGRSREAERTPSNPDAAAVQHALREQRARKKVWRLGQESVRAR